MGITVVSEQPSLIPSESINEYKSSRIYFRMYSWSCNFVLLRNKLLSFTPADLITNHRNNNFQSYTSC